MLTVTDCAESLSRRLDGDPSVSVLTLVNRAGTYLADMHTWTWLVRPAAKLNLTAGSEYINLPDDFGRIYGNPKPTTVSSTVTLDLVSMEEYLRYRQDYLDGGPNYRATVVYATGQDSRFGPKLQIWPEPGTTVRDAFRMPYLARWVDILTDTEIIPIPSWLELLYLEVLFAVAQSYEEHDQASLSLRLAELHASPEFDTAKRRDGGVQPFIGRMRGGAMESEYMRESGVAIGLAGRVLPPS